MESWPFYYFPYEWASALRGLVKLDLATCTAGRRGYHHSNNNMLGWFLKAAVNLEELSIRWIPTTGQSSRLRFWSDSQVHLFHVFPLSTGRLRTLKLTGVRANFFATGLQIVMGRHAATLRHIMLHDCTTDGELVDLVEWAAEVPDIQLHRFAIFTNPESPYSIDWNTPLIPEKLVLDYINSKDPQHEDPFRTLSGESWRTVDHEAESVTAKWPEHNGIHFTCEACGD